MNLNSNVKSKTGKRSRHSDAVDPWLDKLGLYRKSVAYDETCLFRAVSEQMYGCQVHHERVRKECLQYGRVNANQFSHLTSSSEEWFEHLRKLEDHMVVCGQLEIELISRKYNKDVWLFDGSNQQQCNITERGFNDHFLLCLTSEDHYDVVYEKEHIVAAGMCQSIVYSILYENVYQIPNVLDIVKSMLYEKTVPIDTPFDDLSNLSEDAVVPDENQNLIQGNKGIGKVILNNVCFAAPFPFKVAKALDPDIYRNIEYDSWTEVRRELRLGDWYYGDDKLILGTRCVYRNPDTNDSYQCYIQEILKDQDKYVIYITKLAERLTVAAACLSPEDNAKPWPLPYRFSKNVIVSTPTEEKNKSFRKKKDKRRTQSCGEVLPQLSNVTNVTNTEALSEEDVKAFVGLPLQMLTSQDVSKKSQKEQLSPPQNELVMTPIPSGRLWEQPWNPFVSPGTTESYIWPSAPSTPQTPQSVYNYPIKPMVASAPVTPDVVPYHEVPFTVYCNYPQVDPYQSYGSWVNSDYNTGMQQSVEEVSQEAHQTSMTGNASYVQPMPAETYERPPQTIPVSVDQNLCAGTALPSTTQQVDMYSPMVALTPGTPIIYHPTAPPESAPIYNQVESPQLYMSPGTYVYPPTPPSSWFPPGINSQGFVFPPPVPTNVPQHWARL